MVWGYFCCPVAWWWQVQEDDRQARATSSAVGRLCHLLLSDSINALSILISVCLRQREGSVKARTKRGVGLTEHMVPLCQGQGLPCGSPSLSCGSTKNRVEQSLCSATAQGKGLTWWDSSSAQEPREHRQGLLSCARFPVGSAHYFLLSEP